MLAVDVSNYTSDLTPAALKAWWDAGVGLAIVQAIDPPPAYPPGKTRQQIQQCLDATFPVDAYIWIWFDLDVADIQHKLSLLDGLPIRRLWLDVEDTSASKYTIAQREAKVAAALNACDARLTIDSRPTGIYSGGWYWADPRYMANTAAFSDRSLWDAMYDGVVRTDPFAGYGGWQSRAIKQYVGEATLGGVSGIDLNVLSPEEEASLSQPQQQEEPMPDSDPGWQAKKDAVVQLAGELVTVAGQIKAAALRKGGPVRGDILPLSDAVLNRAQEILS